MMVRVYDLLADLRAETGRRNNLLLPPSTTRLIPTRPLAVDLHPHTTFVVVSHDELMLRSIFVPVARPYVVDGRVQVPLFNGSMESLYVQDGMKIAELLVYPRIA